ncbi:MAG: DUF5668 domain-containing protein [Anaerolineae bacterium]|nr:DUF5668 domain-containing protein [Anaerolineae bacterium]
MTEARVHRPGYRSLFWPIILIGVGVVWLLGNLGIVSAANIAVLFRLWPLILIVIGLDLLFGRQSPMLGALIGVGALVLIIVLMLAGPSLGLAPSLDITVDEYSEPLGDAQSARVDLNMSVGEATVYALDDSTALLDAEVAHVGDVVLVSSGESEKVVSLSQRDEDVNFGVNWISSWIGNQQELYWNVGLNKNVLLNLKINSGVGSNQLDLSELQLTALNVSAGVGALNITLPAMPDSYDAAVNAGTGEIRVTIPDGAALRLDINGGVGEVTLDVPDDAAVRVTGSSGVGSINVPGNFERMDSNDDQVVGDRGVWETSGFDNADRQIIIEYDGGVGSLNIH